MRLTRTFSTIDEAKTRVAHWQQRLRLTEWTIRVEIVPAATLDKRQLLFGHVEVLSAKQMAVIRLLDPADFVADLGFIEHQDHELTLIHEMLHIRLHGVRDSSRAVRDISEERAVHALSLLLEEFDAG